MDVNLYVLFDEWSSIPRDIQPYLAEFIKRGILPVPQAVVKIASLEYRTSFSEYDKNEFIGFELGADISTAPDLDDYYVFDKNPEKIIDIYAEIIFRHLLIDLPPNYFYEKYSITSSAQLLSRLFTEKETFIELARASEGVARDLINIFTLSFFHSQRRDRKSIDKRAVIEASRQWFEQDKSSHLDEQMYFTLKKIIYEVIGKKNARSFLLPRNLEHHPMIQKLFDARVIHHMQRGYADKDNPGVRYNIYSLDYGTYVDLIGTSKQPQIDLFSPEQSENIIDNIIVPFDDKRSIRRIILNERIIK